MNQKNLNERYRCRRLRWEVSKSSNCMPLWVRIQMLVIIMTHAHALALELVGVRRIELSFVNSTLAVRQVNWGSSEGARFFFFSWHRGGGPRNSQRHSGPFRRRTFVELRSTSEVRLVTPFFLSFLLMICFVKKASSTGSPNEINVNSIMKSRSPD